MSGVARGRRGPGLRALIAGAVLGLASGAPLCAQVAPMEGAAEGKAAEVAAAAVLCDDLDTAGDPAGRARALLELARLPRIELLAGLDDVARSSPSESTRRGALRALGELGDTQDVRLLVRLTVLPGAATAAPGLRAPYGAALATLLERHPETIWNVADVYAGAPAGIGARTVDAVAGSTSEARAEALARMLGARADVDGHVLAALERVVRERRPIGDGVARRVRGQLGAADARTRQAAALALGALGDVQAIDELIRLAAEPGGFPSSGAEQALREITGLAHASADAWHRWYEREEAWWGRTAPGVLSELARCTPQRAVEILLDLSRRRLHRDEISRAVAVCLRRSEPDLVVLACAALQSLASDAARADLERTLERSEPGVRAAARAALSALGGLEPAEPDDRAGG